MLVILTEAFEVLTDFYTQATSLTVSLTLSLGKHEAVLKTHFASHFLF